MHQKQPRQTEIKPTRHAYERPISQIRQDGKFAGQCGKAAENISRPPFVDLQRQALGNCEDGGADRDCHARRNQAGESGFFIAEQARMTHDPHKPPPGCTYVSGGLIAFAHTWHVLTTRAPAETGPRPTKPKGKRK